ncbi:polysaccharide pyruvyl transferase family protein [Reyranella sp.]|uniref:polysaccharide pyruvyl transferase family protein n=1 Tax=Reyranella sp. TaxID=1929291 RepID=UPI003BA8D8D2
MTRQAAASIALFGTFDVENYGDLLFPLLVRHALCREGETLNAFSPVGASVPWADAMAARPVSQAAASRPDLCIVGGGNIVSAETTPLPAYAPLGTRRPFAYPSLWLGAALVAASSGARLVWNAPGLPAPLRSSWAQELAALAVEACDYIATRDAQSRDWLPAGRDVAVVPDVALGVSEMWPADGLRQQAEEAFLARGVALPRRWIVFHANRRYLDGGAERAAAAIARIAVENDAFPVLVAIGPCHGDGVLVTTIASHLGRCLAVDHPRSLGEVAALIAHSEGYAGSSLHGLITALSYRRPGLAVAQTTMPKFAGFLEQVGMPYRLVEDWSQAEAEGSTCLAALTDEERQGLDRTGRLVREHWEQVRRHVRLADPDAEAARRRLLEESLRDPPHRWQLSAVQAVMNDAPLPCPICFGTTFTPGPGGRLSRTGRVPQCARCRSLERHRIFRLIFDSFRTPDLRNLSCLAFSLDHSASAEWFAGYEVSIYGKRNSLDVQRIDRADASYDVVICNHVLEHVPDYRAALRELVRITRPGGFVFVSFPAPIDRPLTTDWGYPRADQHGHYRVFGRDVEPVLAAELPEQQIIAVTGRDPVTGVEDMAYIITRASGLAQVLMNAADVSSRIVADGCLVEPAARAAASAVDEVSTLAEALRGPTLPEIGERLRDLVSRRPGEPRPRLLLGEWLARTGRLDDAEACFRAAMNDFPRNPWPVARMFRLHLLRNQLPQACDLYVDVLRDSSLPHDVRSVLLREAVASVESAGGAGDLLAKLGVESRAATDDT